MPALGSEGLDHRGKQITHTPHTDRQSSEAHGASVGIGQRRHFPRGQPPAAGFELFSPAFAAGGIGTDLHKTKEGVEIVEIFRCGNHRFGCCAKLGSKGSMNSGRIPMPGISALIRTHQIIHRIGERAAVQRRQFRQNRPQMGRCRQFPVGVSLIRWRTLSITLSVHPS